MKILTLIALLALQLGCSSTPTEPEIQVGQERKGLPASIEAKQIAAEVQATNVTEIRFLKGKTQLTSAQKENVAKLLAQAKSSGEIEEVKVITWADSEYPSVHTKKLSKAELDLVKNRNQDIESFVKGKLGDVEVKTYNMAERPNTMETLLGTSDARIKKSLETAGIPTTDTSVKAPSQTSKSIIMVLVK